MPQGETFSSSQLSRQGDSNTSEEDFFFQVSLPYPGHPLAGRLFDAPLILFEAYSCKDQNSESTLSPKSLLCFHHLEKQGRLCLYG